MSLSRLGARLTRLEDDARRTPWLADLHEGRVQLLAEASTAIGVDPHSVKALCPVCEETLYGLSASMPAGLTDLQAVEAHVGRITAAVFTMLGLHVPDSNTHHRLRQELRRGCAREAARRTRGCV